MQKCVLFLLPLLLGGCATGVKNTSRTFNTVVIDAGHGGHDSGARSRRGLAEKTAALDVAHRLNEKLTAAGFRIVMTRDADFFVPLDERVSISNRQRNAIFVSIHFNHSPRRRISGVETYHRSPYALQLAQRIQERFGAARGVATADFRVLRLAQYPAVLVECGYLSNPHEAGKAASASHREQLAQRIAEALVEQRFGSASPQAAAIAAIE